MSRIICRWRDVGLFIAVLCVFPVYPPAVFADKSPVKMVKLEGAIDRTGEGPMHPFALSGIASHLGKFTAVGEVAFVPGQQHHSETGTGVVVFEAANGDQLVGVVTWGISPSENDIHDTHVHFSWRDSVTFSDGTVAHSTGHFVKNRPPGLPVVGKLVCIRIPFTEKYICTIVYSQR